jgi:hypothetical protein
MPYSTSAEQALKWSGRPQRIELIIADVGLPLRSGIQMAFRRSVFSAKLAIEIPFKYKIMCERNSAQLLCIAHDCVVEHRWRPIAHL